MQIDASTRAQIARALEGDSNAAEHDALAAIAGELQIPWCTPEDREDLATALEAIGRQELAVQVHAGESLDAISALAKERQDPAAAALIAQFSGATDTPPTTADASGSVASAQLAVARLLLALAPGEPREHPDIIEIDKHELARAARASAVLSDAGWAVSLAADGPFVELVAEKRHAVISTALCELLALGIADGTLYLETPARDHSVYEVDMSNPAHVLRLAHADPTQPPLGAKTGTPLADLDLHQRAGALLLAQVPAGTDIELLLATLQQGGLADSARTTIAAAAAAIRDQAGAGESEPEC